MSSTGTPRRRASAGSSAPLREAISASIGRPSGVVPKTLAAHGARIGFLEAAHKATTSSKRPVWMKPERSATVVRGPGSASTGAQEMSAASSARQVDRVIREAPRLKIRV
jgi:hypothetical protein